MFEVPHVAAACSEESEMRRSTLDAARHIAGCGLVAAVLGCATGPERPPVHIADLGANAVSLWAERGAATINQPPSPSGTPEERRPMFQLDMATLHLAIHDAVSAAPPAAQEAAVHAAGVTVLKTLFPQRAAQYQVAYDTAVAAMPAGPAKDQGLKIGAERAAQMLARRANDGRWAEVAPAVPGTAPGAFRGTNPINQTLPQVKPFLLDSVAQVRSAPPPAIDSAAMATDVNETRTRGGEGAPASPREVEDARFHTMPPPLYWTRNLNRFARSQPTLAANARLMALLWVTQADATSACFETKYHYYRWRPVSVITLSDPAWKPRLPTPNHPEYPAAHGCTTGAMAETLAQFFGTRQVRFTFDSTVTNTAHEWATVDAAVEEVREARIVGGMHFRASNLAGEKLGAEVAWIVARRLDERR
jgi:hypothetical protein